jgi:hypothetical protein
MKLGFFQQWAQKFARDTWCLEKRLLFWLWRDQGYNNVFLLFLLPYFLIAWTSET